MKEWQTSEDSRSPVQFLGQSFQASDAVRYAVSFFDDRPSRGLLNARTIFDAMLNKSKLSSLPTNYTVI